MRLSDARLRYRKPKLIYPDHRLPPWLTEDAAARSLEPIVRGLTPTRITCWAIGPLRLIPRLHLLEINVGRLSHFRLKALQVNRVEDGLTPVALPHHRTCGSASGGST
jgi:hypothetical protein